MHSYQNKSQKNITQAKNDTGKILQSTANSPAHINDIIQRAQIAPESLTYNDFMTLHRTIGNRAVAQLMSTTTQHTKQDIKPPLLINSNAQEHTMNDTKPPIQEKEINDGVIQEVMKKGKEYPYLNDKKEHIHKYGKDFHVKILVGGKMKRFNVVQKGKVHPQAKEAKKHVVAHNDEEFIKKFNKALGKHTID